MKSIKIMPFMKMNIKYFKDFLGVIGKFSLLLTIWILSIVVADSLTPAIKKLGKPSSTFFFEFIPFLGLVVGHYIMTKFFEKQTLSYVRISKSFFVRNTLIGLGIGVMWLATSVVSIFLLGQGKLDTGFTLTPIELLIYFGILFVNASMQELLVHGYLLSIIQNKYSKISALIITSLLFLLLHPGAINSGIVASINVFGAGMIFGLITIKFNSLYAASLAHSVWNYFGAVWFGLIPLDNYPSMKLISVIGNPLIIGDKNGMETSITITIILCIVLYYLIFKVKENPKDATALTHG